MDYLQQFIPAESTDYYLSHRMGGYDALGKQIMVKIYSRAKPEVYSELVGAGTNPVVVQMSFADRDFFRPIVGYQCRLSIQLDSYSQLIHWSKADETRYMVEVYEDWGGDNQRLTFVGFLNSSTYQQDYDQKYSILNIRAVDGLALLRNFDFDPPGNGPGYVGEDEQGPVWGVHQLQYVIAYILSKIGNRHHFMDFIPFRWEASMTEEGITTRLLSTPIILAQYYGKNCQEVLTDLLGRFKAQILMSPVMSEFTGQAVYILRCMDVPMTWSTANAQFYDRKGNYLAPFGHGAAGWPVNVLTSQTHFERLGGNMKAGSTYRQLVITQKAEYTGNLIFNGNFKHGKSGWYPKFQGEYEQFTVHDGWMGIKPGGTGWLADTNVDVHDRWILTYFDRILTHRHGQGPWAKTQVTFEARRTASGFNIPDDWRLRVGLEDKLGQYTAHAFWIEDNRNEWVTLSHVFDVSAPVKFVIQAMDSTWGQYLGIRNVSVKMVRTRPGSPGEYIEYEDQEKKDVYTLRPQGFQRLELETIKYVATGMIYNNVLAREDLGFGAYRWYIRYVNTAGLRLLSEDMALRHKHFYEQSRMKISPQFFIRKKAKYTNETVILNGMSVIQDVELKATYAISSMTRNLIPNTVNMELTEYVDYLIENPPAPEPIPWILKNGNWNDEGKWDDTANWKD